MRDGKVGVRQGMFSLQLVCSGRPARKPKTMCTVCWVSSVITESHYAQLVSIGQGLTALWSGWKYNTSVTCNIRWDPRLVESPPAHMAASGEVALHILIADMLCRGWAHCQAMHLQRVVRRPGRFTLLGD